MFKKCSVPQAGDIFPLLLLALLMCLCYLPSHCEAGERTFTVRGKTHEGATEEQQVTVKESNIREGGTVSPAHLRRAILEKFEELGWLATGTGDIAYWSVHLYDHEPSEESDQ